VETVAEDNCDNEEVGKENNGPDDGEVEIEENVMTEVEDEDVRDAIADSLADIQVEHKEDGNENEGTNEDLTTDYLADIYVESTEGEKENDGEIQGTEFDPVLHSTYAVKVEVCDEENEKVGNDIIEMEVNDDILMLDLLNVELGEERTEEDGTELEELEDGDLGEQDLTRFLEVKLTEKEEVVVKIEELDVSEEEVEQKYQIFADPLVESPAPGGRKRRRSGSRRDRRRKKPTGSRGWIWSPADLLATASISLRTVGRPSAAAPARRYHAPHFSAPHLLSSPSCYPSSGSPPPPPQAPPPARPGAGVPGAGHGRHDDRGRGGRRVASLRPAARPSGVLHRAAPRRTGPAGRRSGLSSQQRGLSCQQRGLSPERCDDTRRVRDHARPLGQGDGRRVGPRRLLLPSRLSPQQDSGQKPGTICQKRGSICQKPGCIRQKPGPTCQKPFQKYHKCDACEALCQTAGPARKTPGPTWPPSGLTWPRRGFTCQRPTWQTHGLNCQTPGPAWQNLCKPSEALLHPALCEPGSCQTGHLEDAAAWRRPHRAALRREEDCGTRKHLNNKECDGKSLPRQNRAESLGPSPASPEAAARGPERPSPTAPRPAAEPASSGPEWASPSAPSPAAAAPCGPSGPGEDDRHPAGHPGRLLCEGRPPAGPPGRPAGAREGKGRGRRTSDEGTDRPAKE
jgi:hypothetical protein